MYIIPNPWDKLSPAQDKHTGGSARRLPFAGRGKLRKGFGAFSKLCDGCQSQGATPFDWLCLWLAYFLAKALP
jgi:hypothetical protein